LMGAPRADALADHRGSEERAYFTSDNGLNLREFGDAQTRELLTRATGQGNTFGATQRARYCQLKRNPAKIQWAVNNLETGDVISRSGNAEELYFGASTSKLFVAAALLDKQKGRLTRAQLRQLVKMIVVSSNTAWLDLQKQVGGDGTSDTGRAAVHAFVRRMGYPTIMAFQGWMRKKDGTRLHGNELNALELSRFLFDTYHRKYQGADVLWKVMQATRTGRRKINKYTPANLYLGGKTGTYSGPNASPETIKQATIRAANHAAALITDAGHYGISILSNSGSNEDVAVLSGGLMREYLGVEPRVACP